MRIMLLYCGIIFCTVDASAQSISPDVIATDGDFYYTTFGSVSFTQGEVVIETISNSNIILTQGFQQTSMSIHSDILEIATENGMTIYPNPAQSSFRILISKSEIESGDLKIFDVTGRIIFQREIRNHEFEIQYPLSIGLYFVEAIFGEKVFIKKLVIN